MFRSFNYVAIQLNKDALKNKKNDINFFNVLEKTRVRFSDT